MEAFETEKRIMENKHIDIYNKCIFYKSSVYGLLSLALIPRK